MLTLDPYQPTVIAVLFSFGAIIGSFLNVVIHRLPVIIERDRQDYTLIRPSSACPRCGTILSFHENIPLLSFALQRGRCVHCGGAISWRYPLVEFLTGVSAILVAWRFGMTGAAFAAFVFLGATICIAVIDLENLLVPNAITYPMIAMGLAINLAGTFSTFTGALMGAVGGGAVLWVIYWAVRLTSGKEAIGRGDLKLLAGIGAWLGWQALPLVLVIGCLIGSVVGGTMVFTGMANWGQKVPFAPYLVAGGAGALFLDTMLWDAYWAYFWGVG